MSAFTKVVTPVLALSSLTMSFTRAQPAASVSSEASRIQESFSEESFASLTPHQKMAFLAFRSHGRVSLPIKVATEQSLQEINRIVTVLNDQALEWKRETEAGSPVKAKLVFEKQISFIKENLERRGSSMESLLGDEFRSYSKGARDLATLQTGIAALFTLNGAILFQIGTAYDSAGQSFIFDPNGLKSGAYAITQYGLPGYNLPSESKKIPIAIVEKLFATVMVRDPKSGSPVGRGSFTAANIPVLTVNEIAELAQFIIDNKIPYILNFKALSALSEERAVVQALKNPQDFARAGDLLEERIRTGGFAIDRLVSRMLMRDSTASPSEAITDTIAHNFAAHEIIHALKFKMLGTQAKIDIAPAFPEIFSVKLAAEAETLKELEVRLADFRSAPEYRLFSLLGEHRANFVSVNATEVSGVGGGNAEKELFNGLLRELLLHPEDYGIFIRSPSATFGNVILTPQEQALAQFAVLAEPRHASLAADRLLVSLDIAGRKEKLASQLDFNFGLVSK